MNISVSGAGQPFPFEAFFNQSGVRENAVPTSVSATEVVYGGATGYRVTLSGTGLATDGANQPSAGTITSIVIAQNGVTQSTLSGLSWPFTAFEAALNQFAATGNATQLAVLMGSTTPLSVSLAAATSGLAASDWFNTLVNDGPAPLELYGSDFADAVTGSRFGDFIGGRDGDDSLWFGGGPDTGFGGDGNDLMAGQDGWDQLWGGAGSDTVIGGIGNDILGGAAGDDVLDGGEGSDTLYAYTGNDLLDGGSGADEMWGGTGNDTILAGDGVDTVGAGTGDDRVFGGAGDDVLWGGSGNDLLDGGLGADVIWAFTGDDTVRGGDGDDTLGGGVGNDVVDGGGGNDIVYAFDGADTIFGGWGNDTLFAGRDGDVVNGGTGADELWGSDGRDTLTGGRGNDSLLGGGQGDLFRFTYSDFAGQAGATRDVIEGFVPGEDQIGIYGFADFENFADLTLRDVTGGVELVLAADWTILLSGVSGASALEARDFVLTGADTLAPEILVDVTVDTGASDRDRVTSDIALAGQISDDIDTPSLSATFDNPATAQLRGLFASVGNDGSFELDLAALEDVNGGALSDGAHTLSLVVRDFAGNTTVQEIGFTLDRVPPDITDVALSTTSDSGALGDGQTLYRIVTLTGQAAPGDAVYLADNPEIGTIADADGRFDLSGVHIAEGLNDIALVARDLAGNESESSVSITGLPGGAVGDPVLLWTQIALDTIAADAAGDTEAARALAMNSIAIYDVVAAADGLSPFLVDVATTTAFSLEAAIASASYEVLRYAFPTLAPQLSLRLDQALDAVTDGTAEDAGVALGATIAAEVIRIRDADGWDDFEPYPGGSAPGEWAPTTPFYSVAVTPHYATLDPFVISAPDAFQPDGPPALDSAEYAAALAEVQELGAIDSSTRTVAQTEATRFWQDGAGSYTTPGRWTQIAIEAADAEASSSAASAHMLAMLNLAIADSAIAAWDTKYSFGFWRPIDAIQGADTDGNDATVAEPEWNSLLIAPAHPEYVSGHSTFSGAAAAVLSHVFGEDYAFSTESIGLPGVSRSYDSFLAAAEENGASRIWGGIHYGFSNTDGLELGADVAVAVMDSFAATTDRVAPRVIMDAEGPLILQTGAVLSGRAIDTLSGVGSVSVIFPSGFEQALSVGADGQFTFNVSGFANGTYDFDFAAEDLAGNESAPVTLRVTVDDANPVVSLTGLPDGVTLDDDARLQGTADGTGSALVSLRYAIDGGTSRPIPGGGDGSFDTALDLGDLSPGSHSLTVFATDAAGNTTAVQRDFTIAAAPDFEIVHFLPADGADEIGVTFRPQVTFSRAVDPLTLTNDTFYATDATGAVMPARVVVSADGRTGFMFFEDPMPGSNNITLHLDGDAVRAASDGAALDGNADGLPGGAFAAEYTTVSTTPAPATTLTGRIVGPGPDQLPMTTDDFGVGPDGVAFTEDDAFLVPIAGAEVFILGLEGNRVTTDENGFFTLTGIPAGNVKVAIDGRTATNTPEGVFYPEMVMDVTIEPGRDNTLMGGMGTSEERVVGQDRSEVYLPVISTAILSDISPDDVTEVGLVEGASSDLTQDQRDAIRLSLQPGVAVDESGAPADGAQIGISTVPPELVRDMLPPGLMQHTFDLTIQAPGASTFTTPAELTLPNVFNAPPGTQLNILSFDHTTGRLVIEGTATVSEDGLTVTTDPGQGITRPGWHGMTPPGSETETPDREEEEPEEDCEGPDGLNEAEDIASQIASVASDLSSCLGLFGPFKVLSLTLKMGSFFAQTVALTLDIANTMRDLKNARDEGQPLSNIIAIVSVLDSYKDRMVSAFSLLEDALKRSPISDGISCAKTLVGLLDALCSRGNSTECVQDSSNQSSLCGLVDVAGNLLTAAELAVNTWVEKLSAKELALQATCVTIDQIVAAATRLNEPNRDSENGITTSNGQVSNTGPNQDAALAQIDALLEALELEMQDFATATTDAQQTVANGLGGTVSEEINDAANTMRDAARGLVAEFVGFDGGRFFYIIETEEQSIRGVSDGSGINVFLPDETAFSIAAYDPETGKVARYDGVTAASGQTTEVPRLFFVEPTAEFNDLTDIDADALAAFAEHIIGTSATNADTDGDGILDGAEIEQGLDPLGDFGSSTGIVNSLNVSGQVRDIFVETGFGSGAVAFVLTSTGLAVLDLSNARQPVLMTELALSGGASDGAFDAATGQGIVISGGRALLFDLTDPTAPVEVAALGSQATAVVMVDGLAVLTEADTLVLIEMDSGARIDALDLPGGSGIHDLAREGDHIYALTDNGALVIAELVGELLVQRGSVNLGVFPNNGIEGIFAANGVVYVPANDGFNGGYITVDVSTPDAPAVISGPDDTSLAGHAIALNGSGNALIVGSPGGVFNSNAIDLISVADPQETGTLITRFDLDAGPRAVTIAGGVGYVGDLDGNVHVINYSAFDVNGQPPQVAFAGLPEDIDPGRAGLQVLEGARLNVGALVTDDVQVRRVSLLVDGEVVASDLQFPFDLSVQLPVLADVTGDTVSLQLRAEDTGGNIGLSPILEVQLSPDVAPPVLSALIPSEAGTLSQRNPIVTALFNEAIDPESLTADMVRIVPAGGGVPIVSTGFSLTRQDRSVVFEFDAPALGEYVLEADFSGVSDLAGNPVAAQPPVSRSIFVESASSIFAEASGGEWNLAANWEDQSVPDPTDDVLIALDPGATTVLSGTDATITDVRVRGGTLEIRQADLETGTVGLASATLDINGGTLAGAVVNADNADSELRVSGGTLRGVTLNVDATTNSAGNGYYGSYINIEGGLTVNQSFLIGDIATNTPGYMTVSGTQTIDGTGEIVLSGVNGGYYYGGSSIRFWGQSSNALETLTFGADLTLRGAGQIFASGNDRLEVRGSAVADGGRLIIQNVSQAGADLNVSEENGGQLLLRGLEDARLVIAAGTDVDLGGTVNNLTVSGGGTAHLTGGGTTNGLVIEAGSQAQLSSTGGGIGGYYGISNRLTVEDGLQIDGRMVVVGENANASRLYFSEGQTVSGNGELVLAGEQSGYGYSYSVDVGLYSDGAADQLTFGAGLTVRGTGRIAVRETQDSLRFGGEVIAEGGMLVIEGVDQGGGILNARVGTDGQLILRGTTRDTVLALENGDQVELTHTIDDLTVSGTGTANLFGRSYVSNLVVDAGASVTVDASQGGIYNSSPMVYASDGMTVNGSLVIAANDSESVRFQFSGPQTVAGNGVIRLTETMPPQGGYSYGGRAGIYINGGDYAVAETVTFGAGITLQGSGRLRSMNSEDSFRILGDVIAEDGLLQISNIDQQGADLSLSEGANGQMRLHDVTNATLLIAAGSDIDIDGTLDTVTFSGGGTAHLSGSSRHTDIAITAGTRVVVDPVGGGGTYYSSFNAPTVQGTLSIDGTFEVRSDSGQSAGLYLYQVPEITGTGSVRLVDSSNAGAGYSSNNTRMYFQGDASYTPEVFTMGAGLSLVGAGRVGVSDSNDMLRILGDVRAEDGLLSISALDQGGVALNLTEGTDGDILLRGGMRDGTLSVAAGSTIEANGPLDMVSIGGGGAVILGSSSASLEAVTVQAGSTLRVDTEAHAGNYAGSRHVSVEGGLTVEGLVEIESAPGNGGLYASLTFNGAQTLGGSGIVQMEGPSGGLYYGASNNGIAFNGILSEAETLVIGADLTVTGSGYVRGNSGSADLIDLQGTLRAEGGSLLVSGLAPVSGTLSVAEGAELGIGSDLAIESNGRLEIEIGSTDISTVRTLGTLTLGGTLALDVEAGLNVSLGDTFTFLSTYSGYSGTITGNFASYEGLDLAGNLAFVVETVNGGDALQLRVVTDAEAALAGFSGGLVYAAPVDMF